MDRAVISGGSGFIGSALALSFSDSGWDVTVLSRQGSADRGPVRFVPWDGETLGPWVRELDGARCVINLSGAPISARKSGKRRRRIIDSRVRATALIGEAVHACSRPPEVWVNASGTGFYGSRGDELLDESSDQGVGFLAKVCKQWEDAVWRIETPRTRKCIVRTGVVLGREGGAFPLLLTLVKMFIGGSAGTGRQWMPWIHLEDAVGSVQWLVNSGHTGIFNVCAPNPARNSEVMSFLRQVRGRPYAPPAPAAVLRFLAHFLPIDPTLALDSCRAAPKRLIDSGFEFLWPDLPAAMRELASSESTTRVVAKRHW